MHLANPTGRPPKSPTRPPAERPGRRAGALLAGLAVAALLAGCGSSSHHSSAATTQPARSTSSSATSSSSSTTASDAGPATSSTARGGSSTSTTRSGPPDCATSQLTGSLGAGQGAAGHVIQPIVLTNAGTTTCVLEGYPGVSLLDATGTQIGTPATRATRAVSPVTMAPGAQAEADLETQDEGIAQTPCWAPSASIRVYPPDQRDAVTITGAFTVCGNELTVTPMSPPGS